MLFRPFHKKIKLIIKKPLCVKYAISIVITFSFT